MHIAARRLLAMRDALIRGDVQEAYHQLRMAVDGGNAIYIATGDHWTEVERLAETEKELTE